MLATCLGEEALLTDLRNGDILARIEGDDEVLTALRITPNASHLVACSRSVSMTIYALERNEEDGKSIKPKLLKTLKPHSSPVTTATIDKTGTLLATGGADSVVKVWDIRGGFLTHTFHGHSGVISTLKFFDVLASRPSQPEQRSRKKKTVRDQDEHIDAVDDTDRRLSFRLASGGEDGKIRIWDLEKRKSIALLDSHLSVVRDFDFSSETNSFVSASRDKTVIVWDSKSWKSRRIIPVLEVLEAVSFVAGGEIFATAGEYGQIRLWNSLSGAEVTREQEPRGEGNAIVEMISSSNQQVLISIHSNQSLVFHSTAKLQELPFSNLPIDPLPVLRRISGTHDEIIDLAYVTQEHSLLALADNSEDICLVSLATASPSVTAVEPSQYFGADVALLQGHEDIIICLTTDWSGCWLATGAKDNTARLWRIDHSTGSYESYAIFTGHAESVGAISLPSATPQADSHAFKSPLNHPPPFLLTGSQDRTIKRWIIPTSASTPARALYTRKAHEKDINALALSPTSHLFASASQDRNVKIWSTEEGETQGILRGHKRGVWSVAFAPKDTPPITSSSTGGPAAANRGMVLTGSGDKTVKIWSLNDYTCLRTFEGHTNNVLKVLWLPPTPAPPSSTTPTISQPQQSKSPQIASAGADGLVKIWDPASGECLTTLDNHTDRIWALAVEISTRTLVSGGADAVITFWKDTTVETAVQRDKAATERVEQDQELSNYVHRGQYREAIALALALNHPARLLSLFQNVVDTQPAEEGSILGVKAVDEVVASLEDGQLLKLLERVRDWNTNARTSAVAQRVLNVVVRSYDADRLSGLGRRRGGKEVVEALRVYTERHYKRIDELWGESWVVEFLLGEMGSLVVEGSGEKTNGIEGGEREEDVLMV